MDYPLRVLGKIEDDMFAHPVDALNFFARKGAGHLSGAGFEWLRLGAEPDRLDGLASHAFMDATGDSFDFRQFGHEGPYFYFLREQDLFHSATLNRFLCLTLLR
jgi:hypothetical protein